MLIVFQMLDNHFGLALPFPSKTPLSFHFLLPPLIIKKNTFLWMTVVGNPSSKLNTVSVLK